MCSIPVERPIERKSVADFRHGVADALFMDALSDGSPPPAGSPGGSRLRPVTCFVSNDAEQAGVLARNPRRWVRQARRISRSADIEENRVHNVTGVCPPRVR